MIPPLRHSLEPHPPGKFHDSPSIQPLLQIFTLADIKVPELMATIDNSLDANTRDADAAADGEFVQFE